MSPLSRIYAAALSALGLLSGVTFAAFALLVSADVVGRNLGVFNLPWLIETAEYGLFAATLAAAPWVLHQGAHVRVDLVASALPRPAARIAEAACDVVGLGVCGVLAVYGLRATVDAHAAGALIIKQLIVPEWWLLAVVPATMALMAVEFARRLAAVAAGRAPAASSGPGTEGF